MKNKLDILLEALNPITPKERFSRFILMNIPHKDPSRNWYVPVWWYFLFGGTYDTGNGSRGGPNLYYRIKNNIKHWRIKRKDYKYWQEYGKKYGYTTGQSVKCSTDNGKTYHDTTPL